MGACIIINAPTVFSVAWKMLKGFLDPRTVAKVSKHEAGLCALAASTVPLLHATRSPSPCSLALQITVCSGSGIEELLKVVDKDNLPVEYGGNLKIPGGLFPQR